MFVNGNSASIHNENGTRYIVDSGNVLGKDGQYFVKSEQIRLMNSAGIQAVIIELTNNRPFH